MHRLTFTVISAALTEEEATDEFNKAKAQMPKCDDYSSIRATREEWTGREWVLRDAFQHEAR